MSFALASQSKNKEERNKTSTPVKHPFREGAVNNLLITSHDSIIHLQQIIGNQAVQRLMRSNARNDAIKNGIQPKLKVSQPVDAFEQEADRVAEQVMKMSSSPNQITSSTLTNKEERIDRKCSACKMKKESEEEEDAKNLNISRKPSTTSNIETSNEVTNMISDVRSNEGSTLDSDTKEHMESRFGYDFGRIRIHKDTRAAESAQSVNALAYTLGEDIVFGDGQYLPGTVSGRRLLAHELVHVVQQSRSNRTPVSQGNRKSGLLETSELQISDAPIHVSRGPKTGAGKGGRSTLGSLTTRQAEILQEARKKLDPKGNSIVGVLITDDGRRFEFVSGGGRGGADFNIHIEGKATAKMNELGIKKAMLIVEKTPCQICDRSWYPGFEKGPETPLISSSKEGKEIPRQTSKINTVLPVGSELIVIDPDSGPTIYRGTGKMYKPPPAGGAAGPGVPKSSGISSGTEAETAAAKATSGGPKKTVTQSPSQAGATPKDVTKPPAIGPSPVPSPAVPKVGSKAFGQVTLDYDFSSQTKSRVKIDLADYPPAKEGKITRFFKDHPAMRPVSSFAISFGVNKIYEKIGSYFSSVIDKARVEFLTEFVEPEELFYNARIDEHEETFNAVMVEAFVYDLAAMLKNPGAWVSKFKGAFDYQHAMHSLQEKVAGLKSELPAIAEDIDKRSRALKQIAQYLKDLFWWCMQNGGAMPPIYYFLLDLHTLSGFIDRLGDMVGSFAAEIRGRESQYDSFYKSLDQRLDKISPLLKPIWELYRTKGISSERRPK